MSKDTAGHRGRGMDGVIAHWYTRNMERNEMAEYRRAAREVAEETPHGGSVLELAPGPGFLAIALAEMGRHEVAGLDISHTFVDIARKKAEEAGVAVDFQQGDASAMPYEAHAFDFVICRSAFKNFADPAGALREVHRVLTRGGRALIEDLRADATSEAIGERVASMGLSPLNALLTRAIFRHTLLPRAYDAATLTPLLEASPFSRFEIREKPLELSVSLWK
ncbi:MAG: class I SAM-dependent methyltransferase [Myxococcales bacterium]|nr:class I SAM-dependent methyltransferase [Myxococcales bacterium]